MDVVYRWARAVASGCRTGRAGHVLVHSVRSSARTALLDSAGRMLLQPPLPPASVHQPHVAWRLAGAGRWVPCCSRSNSLPAASSHSDCLDPKDRQRAERLELFDEMEEWHLIQQVGQEGTSAGRVAHERTQRPGALQPRPRSTTASPSGSRIPQAVCWQAMACHGNGGAVEAGQQEQQQHSCPAADTCSRCRHRRNALENCSDSSISFLRRQLSAACISAAHPCNAPITDTLAHQRRSFCLSVSLSEAAGPRMQWPAPSCGTCNLLSTFTAGARAMQDCRARSMQDASRRAQRQCQKDLR